MHYTVPVPKTIKRTPKTTVQAEFKISNKAELIAKLTEQVNTLPDGYIYGFFKLFGIVHYESTFHEVES